MPEQNPSAIDPAEFRRVLGYFPTGVTVVTASPAAGPVGLAIGSFTSVSLDPPLVAFCPTKDSRAWPGIEEAGSFCVNIMADDQQDLCGVFASKAEDKFSGLEWTRTAHTGSPQLPDVLAWMDCTIENVFEGGDHWIVVGRVQALDVGRPQHGPLLFFCGGYGAYGPF